MQALPPVGIDEAGRGPWAGPITAAAVLLPPGLLLPGLTDSKLLTARRRQQLLTEIIASGAGIGLGWASPGEIDRHGLTIATQRAMVRAYHQLAAPGHPVVIDGSFNYLPDIPGSSAVVKADQSYAAVSAASIVAKYYRDQYMTQMVRLFPGYSFERHMGYGTRAHQEALTRLGPCSLHRRSFAPVQRLLGLELA